MGQYLLVLTNDYSRFPIVEVISSTPTSTVIPRIDKSFPEYGISDILPTDNGSPFNSRDFANLAQHLGFRHWKITHYWSRANGNVQRFTGTER